MMIGVNRVMAEEHLLLQYGVRSWCDICCVLLCDERYPTFPGTFCSAIEEEAKAIEVQ